MSYGNEPIPVDVPVPFTGTEEQRSANEQSHKWVNESLTEIICARCGTYYYMVASNYPCGEEPPRMIVYKEFT